MTPPMTLAYMVKAKISLLIFLKCTNIDDMSKTTAIKNWYLTDHHCLVLFSLG